MTSAVRRCCALAFFLLSASSLPAATPQEIREAIIKGVGYLRGYTSGQTEGQRALAALALIKADVPYDSPEVSGTIQEILSKFRDGEYLPGPHHLYQAGIEANILSDIDPEKYRPQLEAMSRYFVSVQMENGGFDYPGTHGPGSQGDTSVMQYACLGLWACERAGVKAPPEVWEKILAWHVKYQHSDGGLAYNPYLAVGDGMGQSTLNMTVNAVGSMHIAMIHLSPNFAPLTQDAPKPPPSPPPKYKILEEVVVDQQPVEKAPEQQSGSQGAITDAAVEAVRRAYNFVRARYRIDNTETGSRAYYYYSFERMAALANVNNVAEHDWYGEFTDFLISKQAENGSWKMSTHNEYDAGLDTAFCVLFLTRSTGRLLRRVTAPGYGKGTLVGGRGLPDDLNAVDLLGGKVSVREQPTEPLDVLLEKLISRGEINLDEQQQIVAQVQIGDRAMLIGKVDQLLDLVKHPDPKIRQTAIWAIGRSDNLSLARFLIESLNDEDIGVMLEARNALCWISRRPLGFGESDDPVSDLPPDATEEQKKQAIALWHRQVLTSWGQWYLDNRPYADRGDNFEGRLRLQIDRLKKNASNQR